jgi:hypothetical protein
MAEESKIAEAKKKMQELVDVQIKVDAGIARMPEGPDKERLKKLRDENRGFFSNIILPAWRKMQTILSEDTTPPKPGEKVWYNPSTWFAGCENGMGLLPLIPIAAVVSATALLGYVINSIVVENRILSDPAFTSAQKTSLLQSGGLTKIADVLGQTKWLALLGAVGLGAYLMRDQIAASFKKANPRRKKR